MADTVKKKSTPAKKAAAKPRKTASKKASAASNGANGSHANGSHVGVSHEQVAQLAHRFWSERGRQHGHHEEDWFRAEQELRKLAS